MPYDLQPLSLSGVLERIVTLYRRHFLLFAGAMAIPNAIMLLAVLPVQMLQPRLLQSPRGLEIFMVGVLVVLFAGMFVFWVAYVLAMGAITAAVSALYRGLPATMTSTWRDARERAPGLLLLTLLVALRVTGLSVLLWGAVFTLGALGAGTGRALDRSMGDAVSLVAVLLMILGFAAAGLAIVFLALRYGLSVPALMVEGIGANAAIRRSVALARGHMGRLTVVVVVALMLTYGVGLLLQTPLMIVAIVVGPDSALWIPLVVGASVLGAAGTTVTAPFLILGLAVLYFDIRIRRENLAPRPVAPAS